MRRLISTLILAASCLLAVSCGGKSSSKKEVFKPTKDSCMALGQLYYPGGCYAPTGINQKTGRFSLLPYPRLLDSLIDEELSVCIMHEAFSAVDILRFQNHFEKSFNVWHSEIKDLTPYPIYKLNFQTVSSAYLATDNEGYFSNCSPESAVRISLQRRIKLGEEAEDREHAKPTQGEIYLNAKSDYATVLHETGHLFGLSDVYVEDVWDCKAGFSNSIMCDHAWEKPILDDIEAVRRSYCLATDGTNSKCFNHQKTGILSFVPNKIKQGAEDHLGAYFMCNDKTFYFAVTYNLVTMARQKVTGGPIEVKSGNFYSTDERSVEEDFVNASYTLSTDTSFVTRVLDGNENGGISTPEAPRTATFTLENDNVTFSIPSESILLSTAGENCSFDSKFLDLLETRGVSVDPGIKARAPFRALADSRTNTIYLEPKNEIEARSISIALNFDASEELKDLKLRIFGNDKNRTELSSIGVSDLKTIRSGDRLTVELPSALDLKPGIYHIFPVGIVSLDEVVLKIPEWAASPSI